MSALIEHQKLLMIRHCCHMKAASCTTSLTKAYGRVYLVLLLHYFPVQDKSVYFALLIASQEKYNLSLF